MCRHSSSPCRGCPQLLARPTAVPGEGHLTLEEEWVRAPAVLTLCKQLGHLHFPSRFRFLLPQNCMLPQVINLLEFSQIVLKFKITRVGYPSRWDDQLNPHFNFKAVSEPNKNYVGIVKFFLFFLLLIRWASLALVLHLYIFSYDGTYRWSHYQFQSCLHYSYSFKYLTVFPF